MSDAPAILTAKLSRGGTGLAPGGVRGGWLDALRFLAAFFVVVYHYSSEAPVPLELVHSGFDRGYLATDFFLILSGFVLGRAYGRSIEEGRVTPLGFLTRRVARIWPAHLIVLVMIIGFLFAASLAGITPGNMERFAVADLIPQALLIQAWGDFGGGGWNLPSWSLSALILCYAVFPLVWRGFARLNPWAGVLIAALLIVAVDAWCQAVLGRGIYDLPFQMGVVRALPLFLLGAALAALTRARPIARSLAIAIGAGALVLLPVLQIVGRFDAVSIAAIAAMIAALGSISVQRPSRLVAYGGRISFALFITHVFAAMPWFGVLHAVEPIGPVLHWTWWTGSLAFAVGLAAVFERFVDQPVQAFIGPRLSRLLTLPKVRPVSA